MGHDITAYTDEGLKQQIAYLRLFPTEAFANGNIYDVLACQEFRRSCCGDGRVAKFERAPDHEYPCEPNTDSERFLDAIYEATDGLVWVWVKFG